MNSYDNILHKLSQFTKKYYTNMLLKGVLLFLALGLLFFLVVLAVEYFLWLSSTGRLVLLVLFVGVALFLLFRYILSPLFYLFQIKRGISNTEASVLIGKHFPDVDDKLLNLLHLAESTSQSELLVASIEQRSNDLHPIPFTKAIDFSDSLKYAKYLVFPVLVFALIWFSGNMNEFFGSYNRVVNYDVAYEPPAPFSFRLLSSDLKVLDSKAVTIEVTTDGKVRPEQVFMVIDGENRLLQEVNGSYQYTFLPPLVSTDFRFMANDVYSQVYHLEALKTPAIQNFELLLEFPSYTKLNQQIVKGTGNATFPEGTKVTWMISTAATESVKLQLNDTVLNFNNSEGDFKLSKRVFASMPYEINTSNSFVSDYETLGYQFKVIKDAYPRIKVKQVLDSLNPNVSYYLGEASDDYLVTSVQLVCYNERTPDKRQVIDLGQPDTNFNQFYYTFPTGLQLEENTNYSFYFQVTDNDGVHRGKTTKSQVFNSLLLDDNLLKDKELDSQQNIINNLDKSLEKFKEQKEALKEINQGQKEKKQLSFNDKNQVKDFLKKQQRQEQMMQKFSKQLKENLNKSNEDEMNKLLKERLERQEIEAKKNEKLLDELNKIADKINKEELAKRLEELAKNQRNSERNLEQLLELTKRYYVEQKAAQLAKELGVLAKKQEVLSELKVGDDFSSEEQKELNEEFNKLSEELDELKKDNADLKKPMNLAIDEKKSDGVKEDQKDALEEINKHEGDEQFSEGEEMEKSAQKASQKQKAAAQKMKEMSKDLQEAAAGGGMGGSGSEIAEDAEMLRQILDNLVTFSFKQENLFDELRSIDARAPQFSATIRKQQELRTLFEHVDDSLFALSLRRAELAEFVNEQITEVYYNTDKTLEAIAESQVQKGTSYQKYVITAANSLSDFLANSLDNMQQGMQAGKGQGQGDGGQGFQLPDIIAGQKELKEKMEGMGKNGKKGDSKGEQGKGKEGEQGGESGESQKGNEGKGGESGNGQEGKSGKSGSGGEGNGDAKSDKGKGSTGESGDGGSGQGNGPSEEELQEIYEIYKEQQQLREQLEQQLNDMINASDRKLGEKLLRQMEDFENDLIENGITQGGLQKINNINYEMLKLKNAAMKQGEKQERESTTGKQKFVNPVTTKPEALGDYRNEVEILNRQALPLRQNFQSKVKEYFKSDD